MHLISDPHFPFLPLIIPVAYAFTPTPQLDKNSSIDDRGQRATGPGTERDQRKKISQRREPSQSSVSWAYFPAPCSPSLPPSLSPPPPTTALHCILATFHTERASRRWPPFASAVNNSEVQTPKRVIASEGPHLFFFSAAAKSRLTASVHFAAAMRHLRDASLSSQNTRCGYAGLYADLEDFTALVQLFSWRTVYSLHVLRDLVPRPYHCSLVSSTPRQQRLPE